MFHPVLHCIFSSTESETEDEEDELEFEDEKKRTKNGYLAAKYNDSFKKHGMIYSSNLCRNAHCPCFFAFSKSVCFSNSQNGGRRKKKCTTLNQCQMIELGFRYYIP